jgi:GAF domain-containing protein
MPSGHKSSLIWAKAVPVKRAEACKPMKNFLKKKTSSGITRSMMIAVLIASIVISLAVPLFNIATLPFDRMLIFSFAGLSAISLAFAIRGNLIVGRIFAPISSFATIGILTYIGGLRDPVVFGFNAVILLAALLLGEFGGLLFGLLSALTVLLIGLGEATHSIQIEAAPPPNVNGAIIATSLIIGATVVLQILIRRLNSAIQSAHANEEAQAVLNKELRTLQMELEKRVDERTAQLRASNEIGQIASGILDPASVIEKAVNLITDSFKYYYAAIFLVSDNGQWAELKDATGSAGEILRSRRHRLQVGGNSMVGAAIDSKKAQIALDVGDSAVRFSNPLLPNTRSEIALPLIVGDHVIGALDVQSTREADFKPDDIATLQGMANQVAIAIENARLFKEMDLTLDELRQSNRQYVVSAWTDKLKGTALEYTVKSGAGLGNEPARQIEIDLNLRDQSIGQIRLETDGEWTQEDQAWVEALSTQVAISLENARLLEESQQAALRERLAASIVQKIWSSSSIDNILQTAVRELGRALEASEATIELKVDE